MKNLIKSSVLLVVFAIAMVFTASPVKAQDDGTFDLTVKHNINGKALGADKELPVDVYANGGYVFTFNFGDTEIFKDVLAAGEYTIEVTFENAGYAPENIIMSLGPVEIPAGADVMIRATLSAGKAPKLRAMIK